MAVSQRYRLKQTPTDVWTVRERLCLASSVLRSGDQNWVSVSRAIKPFGEPNRPPDWFSQKNCALQYSDLLEKVETPKRKRWDRGEKDTPGDLIARKLTIERIEELKKFIQEEQQKHKRIKRELELVRCGHKDDKLDEAWEQIQEELRSKERAELEHQKWLQERETRIAAMKAMPRVGLGPGKKKLPVRLLKVGEIRRNSSQSEQSEQDSTLDSPISEPLSVEVDDVSSPLPPVAQMEGPQITPRSLGMAPPTISIPTQTPHTPPHPTPATSPLLTSLLKSPTPATPASPITSILSSPTPQPKEGTTATQASPRTTSTPQPFFNPTSALATAAARQLAVATAPVLSGLSMSSLFSDRSEAGQQVTSSGTPTQPVHSATSSAPTLSKLLEMPPSTPGKLPPLPIIHATEQIFPTVASSSSTTVPTAPSPLTSSPLSTTSSKLEMSAPVVTTAPAVITNTTTICVTNTSTTITTTTAATIEESANPSLDTPLPVIDTSTVDSIKVEIKDEPSSPVLPEPSEMDSMQSETKEELFEPDEIVSEEVKSDLELQGEKEEENETKSTQDTESEIKETEIEDFLVKDVKDDNESELNVVQADVNTDDKDIILNQESVQKEQELEEPVMKEEAIIEEPKTGELEEINTSVEQKSQEVEDNKINETKSEKIIHEEETEPTVVPTDDDVEVTLEPEVKAVGPVDVKEEKNEMPEEKGELGSVESQCTALPLPSPSSSPAVQPSSPVPETVVAEASILSPPEQEVKQVIEECKPTSSEKKVLDTVSNTSQSVVNEVPFKPVKRAGGKKGRKRKAKGGKIHPLPEVEIDPKEEVQEEEEEEEVEEVEKSEIEIKEMDSTLPDEVESDQPTENKDEDITVQDKSTAEASEISSEEIKEEQEAEMKLETQELEDVENTSVISFPAEDYSSSKQTESSEEPSQDEKSKAPSSVTDSVPNSPASTSQSDDQESLREYKVWKKSIMLVWRAAANHKYANVFSHPVTNDVAPGYHSIVFRPMDLSAIKKNIETGVIKTTLEFQRDMMLMFQNAIMYNSSDHDVFHMAIEMQKEVMEHIQDFLATQLMVQTAETKVLRGREPREKKAEAGEKDEDGKRKRTSSDGEVKTKKRRMRIDE